MDPDYDPMRDDYYDKSFNSFLTVPGRSGGVRGGGGGARGGARGGGESARGGGGVSERWVQHSRLISLNL